MNRMGWQTRSKARVARLRSLRKQALRTSGVEELELSTRSERVLRSLGCETIQDVVNNVSLRDLRDARGCGQKTMAEITQTLGRVGLALRG